jgi:glutaredoxin 3
MKNIIWSKDNCFYCMMAKQTLEDLGVAFEERNVSQGPWTKEQLLEAAPEFKTYPQIFLNGSHIGGFDELRTYIEQTGFNGTGHTL